MADDRNNPNQGTGGRSGQGEQGGADRNAPGRNPNEGQSTSPRDKDTGMGGEQEGNRERNEQGFEKGGSEGQRGQNT